MRAFMKKFFCLCLILTAVSALGAVNGCSKRAAKNSLPVERSF